MGLFAILKERRILDRKFAELEVEQVKQQRKRRKSKQQYTRIHIQRNSKASSTYIDVGMSGSLLVKLYTPSLAGDF